MSKNFGDTAKISQKEISVRNRKNVLRGQEPDKYSSGGKVSGRRVTPAGPREDTKLDLGFEGGKTRAYVLNDLEPPKE